jgi:hypothetical protein
MLVEHPALKPLTEYLSAYLVKGLQAMESGNRTFVATPLEIYAEGVWERVGEVDNCLDAMRLAISEISKIAKNSPPSAARLYRYHYENYLLRLSGMLDRAHRVVGTVIGMPEKRLNSSATNVAVRKSVERASPMVHHSLLAIEALMAEKKATRNAVAHAAAYSSRELGLFTASEHLVKSPLDKTKIQELMTAHFATEVGWLGVLTVQSEAAIHKLLDELAPLVLARVNSDA